MKYIPKILETVFLSILAIVLAPIQNKTVFIHKRTYTQPKKSLFTLLALHKESLM
jgi:hypothetical protein